MKLFLRSLAFLVIASFSPFASAQTYWYYNSSGNFNDSANWSNGVPNTSTSGIINPYLGGTYTVNLATNTTVLGLGVEGSFFEGEFFGNGPGTVNLNLNKGAVLNVLGSTPSSSGGDIFSEYQGIFNITGGTLEMQQGIFQVDDTSSVTLQSSTFNYDYQSTANNTSVTVGNGNDFLGVGSNVATFTESNSKVTMGNLLFVGTNGGSGTYTLENGSTLTTGTQITTPYQPGDANYYIAIGSNSNTGQVSSGTLTILDTSSLTVGANSVLLLGTVNTIFGSTLPAGTTGGNGTIVQNGAGSTLNLDDAGFFIGAYTGGTGTYNLMAGTLNATNGAGVYVGSVAGTTGTINQTGGNMSVDGTSVFSVGEGGTGAYNLSGTGAASFQGGLTIGATGTVTQSGTSSLVAGVAATHTGDATIDAGGLYTISGGSATFNANLFNNGTLTINNTGLVQVGVNLLSGGGTIILGGGTLQLTAGSDVTFKDTFTGVLNASTATPPTPSTIDVSLTSLKTYTFENPLTGTGGISLVGNGTTLFKFTSASGGPTNSYTGATGITAGTVNVLAGDIVNGNAFSSSLNMGAKGTLNLTLAAGAGGLKYGGAINGDATGILNVAFDTKNDVFVIGQSSNFNGTLNLGTIGSGGGTLVVYNDNFGNVMDNGTGSALTVGDPNAIADPLTSGDVFLGNGSLFTGVTTVYSGFTLNANELGGNVNNGDGTFNGGTINATKIDGNVISNNGSLTAGTIVGNVTSNSGSLVGTTIDGSVVANSGNLAATTIGGSVGTKVTPSTGLIASNAALSNTLNAPTLTIGGNLYSTGTLSVRANGTTADNFAVTGAAGLSGTVNVQILQGGKIGTTTYEIVDAKGGFTSAPGSLVTSNPTAIFQSQIVVNPNSVDLEVTQVPLSNFAQNQNQRNVANALDGTNSSLFSLFANIPLGSGEAIIPTALNQLSPEALQYPRNIAFENATYLVQTVDGAEANFRAGYAGLDSSGLNVMMPGFTTGLGRSLLAYNSPTFHQAAPNGTNYYPAGDDTTPASSPAMSSVPSPSSPASPTSDSSGQTISDSPVPLRTSPNQSLRAPPFSEFIGGDVILADLNQNSSSGGKASYTGGDAIAGVTFRMTSHLSAGVLFDYNHTSAKTDSYGSTTKVDSYSPGIFGTFFEKGFYLNGLLSYGYNTYNNVRNIPYTSSTATSSPNGGQFVANLDGGYDFHPNKDWTIGPTLGATYTHLNVDSYTETGAEASESDLAVQSQNASSLRTRLGGHVIYQTQIGSVLLEPNFTLMWQHEFLDNSSAINYQFSNPTFTSAEESYETANPSRDSALVGCGLTANLDSNMALYINYFADVGTNNAFSQSVIGGFKASF